MQENKQAFKRSADEFLGKHDSSGREQETFRKALDIGRQKHDRLKKENLHLRQQKVAAEVARSEAEAKCVNLRSGINRLVGFVANLLKHIGLYTKAKIQSTEPAKQIPDIIYDSAQKIRAYDSDTTEAFVTNGIVLDKGSIFNFSKLLRRNTLIYFAHAKKSPMKSRDDINHMGNIVQKLFYYINGYQKGTDKLLEADADIFSKIRLDRNEVTLVQTDNSGFFSSAKSSKEKDKLKLSIELMARVKCILHEVDQADMTTDDEVRHKAYEKLSTLMQNFQKTATQLGISINDSFYQSLFVNTQSFMPGHTQSSSVNFGKT